MSEYPAYGMAGLCITGGFIGFLKARSRASLIAGSAIGATYAACGYMVSQNHQWGDAAAAATSALVIVTNLPRGLRTRKAPPMMLSTAAILTLGYYARAWNEKQAVSPKPRTE
ncbi:hypothetical protein H4R33_001966 [Dimargaris cristalligena]|uniref:Transmembrane proteins 14C-domain-containing protein n=1 Tax=Dimargaris cristalligena TaxID=215637 RepID=A0A4Q0A363_9FUNG|nr:hypothetical protein H4R33_001966 [Dimargaris cristalligena]RKP39690.1 transmembrane proteins 14C-domain-containing protein [Dimargaris cristalligena]|eukprot:RKP39690.1 transmembrane proteins 14C-domain-containing protein [Dimargaris cristalligena]